MLESFSSLPSIFEFLVLGKDTKNTAEHVIMKKSLFTHARVFHDLYYYMRNFCNLIGLERWYFSLIWNTYMWKLQTFCG